MSFLPLDQVTWKHLGTESFGDETCNVVESAHVETTHKGQRLWVSQKSGRVRGVLSYVDRSDPKELARFDDYREVSPGVWLPFREARTFPHNSDIKVGKWKLHRSELVVEEATTGRNLAERYARPLPKEGDRVQDQRFATAVNYKYRADRTDDEVRKQAEAQHKDELKGQEEVNRMLAPLTAMVGQRAPALPAAGWVGGT